MELAGNEETGWKVIESRVCMLWCPPHPQVPCVSSILWILFQTNSFFILLLCQRKVSQRGSWAPAFRGPCGNVPPVHFWKPADTLCSFLRTTNVWCLRGGGVSALKMHSLLQSFLSAVILDASPLALASLHKMVLAVFSQPLKCLISPSLPISLLQSVLGGKEKFTNTSSGMNAVDCTAIFITYRVTVGDRNSGLIQKAPYPFQFIAW